jgi:anti-sigma B factor antagonist
VIIRPLNRAGARAPVPDGGSSAGGSANKGTSVGGSDVAVITTNRILEPAQLELSVRPGVNGYQVVTVTGELDIATAEQAYSYISDVIDGLPAPVTVDLSGLTFCDASGIGALVRIARHARQTGRQVMLTSVRPSVLKIMRITGLDRAFPELSPVPHAC